MTIFDDIGTDVIGLYFYNNSHLQRCFWGGTTCFVVLPLYLCPKQKEESLWEADWKDCSGCWSLSTNWKGRNVMFPNDFVMELLSRSRSLEVISLLYLRERVRKIYEEALKRNEC